MGLSSLGESLMELGPSRKWKLEIGRIKGPMVGVTE